MQSPNPNPNPNPNQNPGQIADFVKKLRQGVEDAFSTLSSRTIELEQEFTTFNAKFAGEIGQTQKAIVGLREEIAVATPGISGLGGDLQDVLNIQLGIAKEFGTNIITLGETVEDLFVAGKAVGVASEKVGEMVGSFKEAGIEAGLVRDRIQETVDISRSIGVNTTAVFKMVEQNLGALNEYGFEKGVAGLSAMAAQSVMMRVEMKGIFTFADRVFSPEGAINTVSAFQRLGVAVGDLADPFRLMYLASEDVEELQNQVVKMTSTMTYFDEKTKEFKVFPNAKRDLKEIANETGMAYNDLVKFSIGQQKLNMIAKDFRIQGIDEESKMFISNLATYSQDRGGFVVKIGKDEKLVTELTQSDLDQLQNEPVTLEELAKASLTEDELQTALLQQLLDSFAAPTAASRLATDPREVARGLLMGAGDRLDASVGNQRAGINAVNKLVESSSKSLMDLLSGEGSLSELTNVIGKATADIEGGFTRIAETITDIDLGEVVSKYTSSGNIIYEGALKAYEGLNNLYQKVSNFTVDQVVPQTEKLQNAPTKTVVEFADVKYQGNLNVVLSTPTGTPQSVSITDQMAYDLFQNPTFQKQNQMAIQQALASNNYAGLPNTAS
jgi:hypothetical protein